MQTRKLSNLGLFSSKTNNILYPSFADGLVNLDHSLDEKLIELYSQIDLQQSEWKSFNPVPDCEITHFNSLSRYNQQEILVRNILLLSRLFIRNARLMNLPVNFSKNEKINILDLGCDFSPNLIGILAIFGIERVKYVGVDFYKPSIDECENIYKKLSSCAKIKFIQQDARDFLLDSEYKQKFDLVLVQHPNLQSDDFKPIFKNIFLQINNVLSPGGILYSTFYTKKEVDYFSNHILPEMTEMPGYKIVRSDAYSDEAILKVENEPASSENYIFISPKLNAVFSNLSKPGLTDSDEWRIEILEKKCVSEQVELPFEVINTEVSEKKNNVEKGGAFLFGMFSDHGSVLYKEIMQKSSKENAGFIARSILNNV